MLFSGSLDQQGPVSIIFFSCLNLFPALFSILLLTMIELEWPTIPNFLVQCITSRPVPYVWWQEIKHTWDHVGQYTRPLLWRDNTTKKRRLIYALTLRCDGRLKAKTERSTRLTYTGWTWWVECGPSDISGTTSVYSKGGSCQYQWCRGAREVVQWIHYTTARAVLVQFF